MNRLFKNISLILACILLCNSMCLDALAVQNNFVDSNSYFSEKSNDNGEKSEEIVSVDAITEQEAGTSDALSECNEDTLDGSVSEETNTEIMDTMDEDAEETESGEVSNEKLPEEVENSEPADEESITDEEQTDGDEKDEELIIHYRIRFLKNDKNAKGKMDALSDLESGKWYTLPACGFKKKGFTCAWNTMADGSGVWLEDQAMFCDLTTIDGAVVDLYAIWSKTTYSITYDLRGGINNSKNPNQYDVSSRTIVLKKPKRKGYTFVGWFLDEKCKKQVTDIPKGSTGDFTLYAKWLANKYSVSFNGNKATSGTMNSLTNRKYDKTYTLKKNKYKRTGYVFVGWNTKKNGTGVFYENGSVFSNLAEKNGANVVLYAQWEKETYTITYQLDGGTNHPENPTSYSYGSRTIRLKNPVKEGYDFDGWYFDENYSMKTETIAKKTTGNIVLYAKWKCKSGYDTSKAVEYAYANAYSTRELCAGFVSNCLQAGGVPIYQALVSNLATALENNGFERSVVKTDSFGRCAVNSNLGVSEGDVIIYYCTVCEKAGNRTWKHAAIITKVTNGYAYATMTNNPHIDVCSFGTNSYIACKHEPLIYRYHYVGK